MAGRAVEPWLLRALGRFTSCDVSTPAQDHVFEHEHRLCSIDLCQRLSGKRLFGEEICANCMGEGRSEMHWSN